MRKVIHYTLDPIHQVQCAEVQDKTQWAALDFEIRLQLSTIAVCYRGGGLHFDNDTVFHDEICDEALGIIE